MKLLPKISLILTGGIGTALLVAGILDFYYTRAAWERSISSQQVELGVKIMDEIDRFLYERYIDIRGIGEDQSFEEFLEKKQTVPFEIEDHIQELATFSGPWDTLFLINANGIIIASTEEDEVGKKIEEEPLGYEVFKQLIAGKSNIYYSDLAVSEDTGKPVIMFAAPVRSEERTGQPIIGIVIGNFAWQAIQDILLNTETDTEFNLYTKDGKLIATNRESPGNLFVIEEEVLPLIQETLKEGRPVTSIGTDVEDVYGEELRAVVPSSGHLGYKGNGWILFAEASVESVFTPARVQATRAVLLLISGFLIALGATLWFLSKFVISNIISLTELAKTIAGGDLSKRIDIKSHDEIGQLAASFNEMAEKLKEYYSGLEQKVLERTKELETVRNSLKENLDESNRINKLMVGRELKMVELKKETEELKERLG